MKSLLGMDGVNGLLFNEISCCLGAIVPSHLPLCKQGKLNDGLQLHLPLKQAKRDTTGWQCRSCVALLSSLLEMKTDHTDVTNVSPEVTDSACHQPCSVYSPIISTISLGIMHTGKVFCSQIGTNRACFVRQSPGMKREQVGLFSRETLHWKAKPKFTQHADPGMERQRLIHVWEVVAWT